MGSLRSPQRMDLVRQFLSLCMSHAIIVEVRLIPVSLNVLVDAGSRDKPSVTDNCLDPETLSYCFGLAGLRSYVAVDLCATKGIYEVQPICLSMQRQQPKVCGMGCQGSGLVSFPASLSFPPQFLF